MQTPDDLLLRFAQLYTTDEPFRKVIDYFASLRKGNSHYHPRSIYRGARVTVFEAKRILYSIFNDAHVGRVLQDEAFEFFVNPVKLAKEVKKLVKTPEPVLFSDTPEPPPSEQRRLMDDLQEIVLGMGVVVSALRATLRVDA